MGAVGGDGAVAVSLYQPQGTVIGDHAKVDQRFHADGDQYFGVAPADFARLAGDLGVAQTALTNFFRILQQQPVPLSDLDAALRQMAQRLREAETQLAALQSDDPAVQQAVAAARAALDAGDLAQAEAHLTEALAADDAALQNLQAHVVARQRSAASSAAALAELKWTQFAYDDALHYFDVAVQRLPAEDRASRARYLSAAGVAALEGGRHAAACNAFGAALQLREQDLGPTHIDVAASLNNLAEAYKAEQRYDEALPLLVRAHEVRAQVLGQSDVATARGLNSLGDLYRAMGLYEAAEATLRLALRWLEEALGPSHGDTGQVLNNLAMVYKAQARYDDAEPMSQRALAISEHQRGPHHPLTARALNNLAELYRAQGRYDDAEPLYQRALEILERAGGHAHPDVVVVLQNLGLFYHAQDRHEDLVLLMQRMVALSERIVGSEHPDTRALREQWRAVQLSLRESQK